MKGGATILAAIFLAAMICLPAPAATILPSTVAYWRFEDDLSDGAEDESPNANDATAVGPTPSSSVFGSPVPHNGEPNIQSLRLDNGDDADPALHYLELPDNPNGSLDIATGSFTIEAWVRLDTFGAVPSREYLVHKKSTGNVDGAASFTFYARAGTIGGPGGSVDSPKLMLELHDTGHAALGRIYSDLELPDFDWHFISVALDATTDDVRFTLDHESPDVKSAAGITRKDNDQSLFIGAHAAPMIDDPPNQGFDGHIDELRISNEFLPVSQLLNAPEPSAVIMLAIGWLAILPLVWRRARR